MMRKINKYSLALLLTLFVSSNSHAFFGFGEKPSFQIVVQGNDLKLGSSRDYIENKLGMPSSVKEDLVTWRFNNGLTFSATFDDKGLNESSLSSSQPLADSYAIIYGEKVNLGLHSIAELESFYGREMHCLSYYESNQAETVEAKANQQEIAVETHDEDSEQSDSTSSDTSQELTVDMSTLDDMVNSKKLGWLDLQLVDKTGTHAVFSAINASHLSLSSYEGQLAGMQAQVDNITISNNLETFNTNIYCSP